MTAKAWVRFSNVLIPQGATIVEAFIRFTSYDDQTVSGVNLNCYLVNADNPSAPANKTELDAFSLTSAVAWDGLPAWSDGDEQNSIKITNLVQSIVNRGGWSAGNAMIAIIDDDGSITDSHRKFSAEEYLSGAEKPKLYVAWRSSWRSYYDSLHWWPDHLDTATNIETSWDSNNSRWDFNNYSDSDGGRLKTKGNWAVGFRPELIRVFHDHTGTPQLIIRDKNGVELANVASYTSGDEVTLNWVNRQDLQWLDFVLSAGDNDVFHVTDIWFSLQSPTGQTSTSTTSTVSSTSSTASTLSTVSTATTASSTASSTSTTGSTSTSTSTSTSVCTTMSTHSSSTSTLSSTSTSTSSSSVSSSTGATSTSSTASSSSSTASTASTASTLSTTSSSSTSSSSSSTASTLSTTSTSSSSSSTASTISSTTQSTTTSTTSSSSSTASTISSTTQSTTTSSSSSTASTISSTTQSTTTSTTSSSSSTASTLSTTSTSTSSSSTVSSTSTSSSSSSTASTLSTTSSTTTTEPVGWLSGWDNRLEFEIDSTKVDAALSNFPVMLKIKDSTFWQEMGSGDSLKIAVTEDDAETECYVEVERWDDAGNLAILWFKAPSISSSSNQKFYLYYDKDHADNTTYIGAHASATAQNVWDSSYEFVIHFADSDVSSGVNDSTGNNHDFTTVGSGIASGDKINAPTGFAVDFERTGGNDYFGKPTGGYDPSSDTEFTMEAFVKAESFYAGVANCIFRSHTGLSSQFALRFNNKRIQIGAVINSTWRTTIWGSDQSTDTWYYVAGRHKSTESLDVFLDDSKTAGSSYTGGYLARNDWEIGDWTDTSNREYDGPIAEIRYSSTKRTDAWLKASSHSFHNTLVSWVSSIQTTTSTTTTCTTTTTTA